MIQTAKQTTTTSLSALLKDYVAYNLWANITLVKWLKTKPEHFIHQEIPSSFPSIKETLYHMLTVQIWWLGILRGISIESLYGKKYEGTIEDLFDGFIEQCDEFCYYVNGLTDAELQQKADFAIPSVGEFTQQKLEIIQHTINHSTYHRGQVITIGRNLGFTDAPMTDYMFYLLMAK